MAELRVLLHAPTPAALQRARSNAVNLRASASQVQVRIIANSSAVEKAVGEPDPGTDTCLTLCQNSLRKHGVEAPGEVDVTPAAILLIVELQQQGWIYIRA